MDKNLNIGCQTDRKQTKAIFLNFKIEPKSELKNFFSPFGLFA